MCKSQHLKIYFIESQSNKKDFKDFKQRTNYFQPLLLLSRFQRQSLAL